MKNMSNVTGSSGKIPPMSTPGEKTIYIFTSEIENVAEDKLKIAGDYYSLATIVANKGDKVTVHFYNVDEVKTERHSFTIGDPYKVDIDLGYADSGNATFTADQSGVLLQISLASYDRTTCCPTIILSLLFIFVL